MQAILLNPHSLAGSVKNPQGHPCGRKTNQPATSVVHLFAANLPHYGLPSVYAVVLRGAVRKRLWHGMLLGVKVACPPNA
jgi:hypothetical protein